MRTLHLLSGLLLAAGLPPQDAEVVYPPGVGFTDVRKDCGTKGDGIADDTAALRQAIEDKDRTIIGTAGGGRTELLGGYLYKIAERIGPAPAFTSVDSSISLVYKAIGVPYQVHVEETRGGEKKQLPVGRLPAGPAMVPLYAGYREGAAGTR